MFLKMIFKCWPASNDNDDGYDGGDCIADGGITKDKR